jgi:hypothetical protein
MSDACARLTVAIEGLLYSTESDSPFSVVSFPGVRTPVSQLTPERVAAIAGTPAAKASEVPFERFLARQISPIDPENTASFALAPRYARLANLLRELFPVVRVFRVGVIQVRILALGNDPVTGDLVGIETLAVET